MTSKEELEQAIALQESLRGTVDDNIIDATIATLREKLASLESPEQQRKLVTLLFVDIVGSTSKIAVHLDPEDTMEIMDGALKRLAVPVEEHGGHVTRFMGDGFMAIFGAPTAQEDDPERAVRAGLGILEAAGTIAEELADRWKIQGFQVRAGVNSGLVALGGLTEAEDTVMGQAVHIAARLESAAPPGGLLISHDTYRHVRGVFDVEPQEPITAKGFDEPVPVYRVLRAKPRAFRRTTRGVEGVETRMIGREEELKQLQDAFSLVLEDGELQMITVVGDAGVGKSRLLYEFENWVDLHPERVRLFKGRAGLEMQARPYGLLRDLFLFRFQILENDPAQVAQNKFETGFAAGLEDDQAEMKAHIVGQLLGFDFRTSPHLQNVLADPQQVHDRALMYLRDYFKAIAAQVLVAVLLEDLHWADDSSLDLLTQLTRMLHAHPILVVGLARPTLYESRPHWGEGLPFHTQLRVESLSERFSRRLAEEILQKAAGIPDSLLELIIAHAEGNPFYVEELIKMLIEDGVIIKGEKVWQVMLEKPHEVRVPATLTGVLQARLEGLSSEERTVLQQAAVVGRIFWEQIVQYINDKDEQGFSDEDIRKKLDKLRVREMVFRRKKSAFAETREYIFKHALLREVTYESVLKRVRRRYHALVAQWMIVQEGEREGEFLGLIADHLEQARQTEEACAYLQQAGKQAAERFAHQEALAYYTRALALVPETDGETRWGLHAAREKTYDLLGNRELQAAELETMEQLSTSLDGAQQVETTLRQAEYRLNTGDYPKAQSFAEQARILAREMNDRQKEGRALGSLGLGFHKLGDIRQAIAYHERKLTIAKEIGDRQLEGHSLGDLGNAHTDLGEVRQALKYYEHGLAIAKEIGDQRREGKILGNLGLAYWNLGDMQQAIKYHKQALAIAKEIGDRRGEGAHLGNLGLAYGNLGNFQQAIGYHERALAIAKEIGERFNQGIILGNLGVAYAQLGELQQAIVYFEQALANSREIGNRNHEGNWLGNLGAVYAQVGELQQAIAYYEQGLAIAKEVGNRNQEGLWLGNLGEVYGNLGEFERALALCEQALVHSREASNRPYEGMILTFICDILTELGQFEAAEERGWQAIRLREDLGVPHLVMESRASLARAQLTQGKHTEASEQVAKILAYLDDGNSLDGAEAPQRIYLTCYKVLAAVQDPRAARMLESAQTQLQEQLAKTPEEFRRSFLENIPWHREIVTLQNR